MQPGMGPATIWTLSVLYRLGDKGEVPTLTLLGIIGWGLVEGLRSLRLCLPRGLWCPSLAYRVNSRPVRATLRCCGKNKTVAIKSSYLRRARMGGVVRAVVGNRGREDKARVFERSRCM